MKVEKPSKKPLIYYCVVAGVILLLLNAFVFPFFFGNTVREVSYDDFIQMVDAAQVKKVARSEAEGLITFTAKDENGKLRVYKTGI